MASFLLNTHRLPAAAKRIVSLVPSQTELLYELELDEEVVGITKFCVHPEKWFRSKQRVGGTKTVNIAAVKALKPDLIIANKEENVKEQIEQLGEFAPVWVSDINNLEDALKMIRTVGELVGKQGQANEMAADIQAAFDKITPLKTELNTAYLIWKDPYMAAGGDTFIHDMLKRCGLTNICEKALRYPEVNVHSIVTSGEVTAAKQLNSCNTGVSPSLRTCQLLLLSSEPYPFKNVHIHEFQSQLPNCKILLVDGEMFSWYGSRLLLAADYFKRLIQQFQG